MYKGIFEGFFIFILSSEFTQITSMPLSAGLYLVGLSEDRANTLEIAFT